MRHRCSLLLQTRKGFSVVVRQGERRELQHAWQKQSVCSGTSSQATCSCTFKKDRACYRLPIFVFVARPCAGKQAQALLHSYSRSFCAFTVLLQSTDTTCMILLQLSKALFNTDSSSLCNYHICITVEPYLPVSLHVLLLCKCCWTCFFG